MTVDLWPFTLLDPDHHRRLVDNLDDVCGIANVPKDMLDRSMKECGCSEAEVEWVRSGYPALSKSKRKGGLILHGRKFKPDPANRMMAMGAAFLRNYIDARVETLHSLLPKSESDERDMNPTVLLVPDFHCKSSTGGMALANWQVKYLYSLLVERFLQRRATVLYVESVKDLVADYGLTFHDFLIGNWEVIESN